MVQDEELLKAINSSSFHVGMAKVEVAKMQQRYRHAIKIRLVPRAIALVQLIASSVVTGKYRESITAARKLVSMMERISED